MKSIDIIKRDDGKVLGIEKSNNREYFVKDFSDSKFLKYFLYDLNTHEVILTDNGLKFLLDYYGIDDLVNQIQESVREGVSYKYSDREDLEKWLLRKGKMIPEIVEYPIGSSVEEAKQAATQLQELGVIDQTVNPERLPYQERDDSES